MRRFVYWQTLWPGFYKQKKVATKLDSSSMHRKMTKMTANQLALARKSVATPKRALTKLNSKDISAGWLFILLLYIITNIVLLSQTAIVQRCKMPRVIAIHMESTMSLAAWSGERTTPSIGTFGIEKPIWRRTLKDCRIMLWERIYIKSFGELAILETLEVSGSSYRIVERLRCDKFILNKMESAWGSCLLSSDSWPWCVATRILNYKFLSDCNRQLSSLHSLIEFASTMSYNLESLTLSCVL